MKKTNLLISCFLLCICSFAQKAKKEEEKIYLLDENYKGATLETAKYFIRVAKRNDTCWQFDTYNIYGPLISSERYKDEKGEVLHGQSVFYNNLGTRDSICNFYNGFADGPFYFLNDTGKIYLQKDFSKGILVGTTDRIKKDSIEAAIQQQKKDTVKYVEVESSFAGGDKGWARYLQANLVYPDRAQKIPKQGSVVVQFIVDTEGRVSDLEIVKSVEFSLDEETLRIIKESPRWTPAMQNGKKVKSYKKQPLSFKLQ